MIRSENNDGIRCSQPMKASVEPSGLKLGASPRPSKFPRRCIVPSISKVARSGANRWSAFGPGATTAASPCESGAQENPRPASEPTCNPSGEIRRDSGSTPAARRSSGRSITHRLARFRSASTTCSSSRSSCRRFASGDSPSIAVNASIRPSGDHSTLVTGPGCSVSRIASPPLSVMTYTCVTPRLSRSDRNAMAEPSGDQRGAPSTTSDVVSRREAPPSALTSQIALVGASPSTDAAVVT